MGMKFNNLNLGHKDSGKEFTKEDVQSVPHQETEEKVDYDKVAMLGKTVNLKDVTNTAFNLKYIPREKLKFNPNNDFDIRDIESLSESLLLLGLQHNLGAYYDADSDVYILESGERRLRAFDQLFEKYGSLNEEELANVDKEKYNLYIQNIKPFFEKGFPVNIKRPKYQETNSRMDVIDSELRKYKTNIDVRELTPQERAEYIVKVKKLIEERNQLLYGASAPMPTKTEIAEAVGTSVRQLSKYEALDNLIPALRAEFEAGKISINRVPKISALPEDEQMIVLDLLQKGKTVVPEQVKLYKEHVERADLALKEAEDEVGRLKEELREARTTREHDIADIVEKSRQREETIRREIEKAVSEKNEDLIIRLQEDLVKEKESSGRLISETNRVLATTKQALEQANKKVEELSLKEQSIESTLQLRAEMKVQFLMLMQATEQFWNVYDAYAKDTSLEEAEDKIESEVKLLSWRNAEPFKMILKHLQ